MDSSFNKSDCAIKSISAAVDDECKFKRFIDQCRYEAGKTARRLGDFFCFVLLVLTGRTVSFGFIQQYFF